MEITINGVSYDILEVSLQIPIRKCWDIDYLRIASEVEVSEGQSVSITLLDKTLNGTIVSYSAYAGITTLVIAAGTFKIGDEITSGNFYGGIIRDVVNKILTNTGMTLSSKSDQSILNTSFNRFDKIRATGSMILDKVLELVPGAIWRIELDGTLFIGKEEYVDIQTKYPNAVENDTYTVRDKSTSTYNIYTMDILFEPGFIIDNKKVQETSLILESSSVGTTSQGEVTITTLLSFLPPEYVSSQRLQSSIIKDLIYLKEYPATVIEQPTDETVSIYLDSQYQDLFEGGLRDVPIIHPFPNVHFRVKAGARCILKFLGGNPTTPVISGWFGGQSELITCDFADNATTIDPLTGLPVPKERKGIASIDDTVNSGSFTGTAPPGGGPITFIYTPYNSVPQAPNLAVVMSNGKIITGSSIMRTG